MVVASSQVIVSEEGETWKPGMAVHQSGERTLGCVCLGKVRWGFSNSLECIRLSQVLLMVGRPVAIATVRFTGKELHIYFITRRTCLTRRMHRWKTVVCVLIELSILYLWLCDSQHFSSMPWVKPSLQLKSAGVTLISIESAHSWGQEENGKCQLQASNLPGKRNEEEGELEKQITLHMS